MEHESSVCACSGIRSCLLCEKSQNPTEESYYTCWFCAECREIYEGNINGELKNSEYVASCSSHNGIQKCYLKIKGIEVYPDFITFDEESYLVDEIEKSDWKMSQSGRRKQDFGPQVNFKKQKVKMGNFSGFPSYCKFLLDRMKRVDSLSKFYAVELCNLEYMSERGSSIDPHIDDTWLWGEQLVTVNLLSSTILTLKKIRTDEEKDAYKLCCNEVQILMPPRSLMILESDARYVWTHCIKREHVGKKRIAMTFRNLSNKFITDEKQKDIVKKLYETSEIFLTGVS